MIKRRCRLRRGVPSAFEVHTADRTVRFEVESAHCSLQNAFWSGAAVLGGPLPGGLKSGGVGTAPDSSRDPVRTQENVNIVVPLQVQIRYLNFLPASAKGAALCCYTGCSL